MSWLNFNDSLNSLKGQLSNLANTVLAEDNLENRSESGIEREKEPRPNATYNTEDRWTWSADESKTDQLKTDETITNLKKKIEELQNENREHVANLVQLDQQHQQETEKLVEMRSKLSEELEIVTEKYEILNAKYNKLALAENGYKKKIAELKNKYEECKQQEFTNTTTNSDVSHRYKSLEEENSELREIIKLLEKSRSNPEQLNNENELAELRMENKALEIALQTTAESMTSDQITKYEEEIEMLKNELKSLKEETFRKQAIETKNELKIEDIRSSEEYQILYNELEKLKKDKDCEISQYSGNLEKKNVEIYELKGKLKRQDIHSSTGNQELHSELEKFKKDNESEISQYTEILKKKEAEIVDITDKLGKENLELSEKYQKLQSDMESLEKKKELEISGYTEKLKEKDVEINQLTNELKRGQIELSEEYKKHQNELVQLEKNKGEEISYYSEKLNNKEAEIIELTNEIKREDTSLLEEHQQLQNELKKLKISNEEEISCFSEKLKEKDTKIEELVHKLTEAKKEIDDLDRNYADLQTINRELKNLSYTCENTVENLRMELYDIKKEKDLKEFREKDHEKKVIQIINDNFKEYLDGKEISDDFESAIKSISNQIQLKFEDLEIQLQEVSQNKDYIQNEKEIEIQKLSSDLEILEHELSRKAKELRDAEDECSQLMKNNELLISELEKLKEIGLQTIYESNEDNVASLEKQLETACKRIAELEALIAAKEQNLECDVVTDPETGRMHYQPIIDELRIKLQDAEREKDNYKDLSDKIKLDMKELEEASQRKMNELEQNNEKKCGELEQHLEGITQEKNNIDKKIEEYKLNIESLENEIKVYKEGNEKLKHVYFSLMGEEPSNQKEFEISKVAELADTLKEQMTVLQQENAKLVSSLNKNPGDEVHKELQNLVASRNELIAIVQTKHQETLTYHAEIQRLSEILKQETEKNLQMESEIAKMRADFYSADSLKAKEEEIEKLNDQIVFLRQKCDVLAQSMLDEQQRVENEKSASSEKEAALTKKLERLQSHLMEVEEHYTQELLQSEQAMAALQARLNEVEKREKDSSNIYTSVSIRANQQNEALTQQLQMVTSQRDEFRKKMLDLEDENNVKAAALSNLQLVLEQFRRDKDADVIRETERIRRQMKQEQKVQEDLKKEIAALENQIKESKQGLQAALRLTDQLEMSKNQISTLKEEVSVLTDKLQKKEEELKMVASQTDGKVDKSLIKNLVIGFVTSNKNLSQDQKQILKIIATVLDFNEQEHGKVNLNQAQQNTWLHSLLSPMAGGLPPEESLSRAFVDFLVNESKPRVVPSLLPQGGVSETSSTTTSSARTTPTPIVLNEIVLPTFSDFPQQRNSSSILKGVLKDNP